MPRPKKSKVPQPEKPSEPNLSQKAMIENQIRLSNRKPTATAAARPRRGVQS